MAVLTVTLHSSLDRVLEVFNLSGDKPVVARLISAYAGGKGINAARALSRMGIKVTTTGFQGGYSGDFCIRALKSEGIDTSFIHTASDTRLTTIIHQLSNSSTFVINEPGQDVTNDEANALMLQFESLIPQYELCLFCGSGQVPTVEDLFFRMGLFASEHGVRCLLDSSSASLQHGIQMAPFLVKVNILELQGWFGRALESENHIIQALNSLIHNGVSIAAVSRGADGLIATDGTEVWSGRLHVKNPINTVGCGDSALAGIAIALLNGASLNEIIRMGVACGAANTQSYQAGAIDSKKVRDYFELIDMTKLI